MRGKPRRYSNRRRWGQPATMIGNDFFAMAMPSGLLAAPLVTSLVVAAASPMKVNRRASSVTQRKMPTSLTEPMASLTSRGKSPMVLKSAHETI